MAGQRKLEQDAVDRRIGVERCEQRLDLFLVRGRGQAMFETRHAGGDRRLALGADIDSARRIVADEHDRQPRHAASRGFERRDGAGNACAQPGGERFAVDDARFGRDEHQAIPLE